MFNITDHCPHLIPMETSLLINSLSLLPLGMASMGWDEEETLEQGSSLILFILQCGNFH